MSDGFGGPAPPPGGPPRSTPLGAPGPGPMGPGYPSPGPGHPSPPPGYGAPPMAQPQWAQPPQRQGTNGLAIAGFVLALLWLCAIGSILGIIFGFVALAQIRSSQQSGRGLAIAGIVLGIVGILATVAGAIIAAMAAEDLLDEVPGERDDVTISECVAGADGDPAAELTILNDSSKRSDYFVIVRFESGDESVEVEFDGVQGVEPGQTVVRTVTSDADLGDGYDCVLDYVQRTATSTSEGD